MDREPKVTGAATALLIALPFGLALAWSQSTVGPSRAELAAALSHGAEKPVRASDIESIACEERAASGYQCRWRQRVDEVWQARSAAVSTSGDGWRILTAP